MDAALGNNLVRLEAPSELPGEWDGPVYARLGAAARRLAQGDRSEFSVPDDIRRPGWLCSIIFLWPGQVAADVASIEQRTVTGSDYWIPFWRLTQPRLDLAASEETARPLLSVFRFLRFCVYYESAQDGGDQFTCMVSDVFLCGQVLAYSRIGADSLVDANGTTIEPGSPFICHVEIRRRPTEPRRVVGVLLTEFRALAITRQEFVLGFAHGIAATTGPINFDVPWASIGRRVHPTRQGLRRQLLVAFERTDAPGATTIDIESEITMVLPTGQRTTIDPIAFARDAWTSGISVEHATGPYPHRLHPPGY
jgi:hypothetical protein